MAWTTTPLKAGPLASNSYTWNITGLTTNAKYIYRAYIIVSGVTYYGNILTGTTAAASIVLPTVQTGLAGSVTPSSFIVNGNYVQDKGGAPVVEYGILYTQSGVWSFNLTYENVDGVNVKKTSTFADIAIFPVTYSASTSGLAALTTTYYRAFAKTAAGVGYGEVENIVTTASTAEIFFASIVGGAGVMGGNNVAGKTFSITFSYNINAACDRIGVSDPNSANTNIEISTDGGLSWTLVDDIQAYVSGGVMPPDDSDYQESNGTYTINGITNLSLVRWRGSFNCNSTQLGQSGGFIITITNASANVGMVLILSSGDQLSDGCYGTLQIS